MSTSSLKQDSFSFLNFGALGLVSLLPYVTLSGPLRQVEDVDFQPARTSGILGFRVSLAKGLWRLASAFLPVGLTPHEPLIHLAQQEALKLPFQWSSPACCGL